jgi:hypothetical protein
MEARGRSEARSAGKTAEVDRHRGNLFIGLRIERVCARVIKLVDEFVDGPSSLWRAAWAADETLESSGCSNDAQCQAQGTADPIRVEACRGVQHGLL